MVSKSKRLIDILKEVDTTKTYSMKDAVETLKKCPSAGFNESLEMSMMTGVDPKKSDQQVRSTVILPHGTGKQLRLVVLAQGDNVKKAQDAGASEAGNVDLIEKIKGGWTDFDVLIATPDMMREVGKLGKILGPRGLMPTPKAGTVTTDVEKAVTEAMKGKVEFKVDKSGVINNLVGKMAFTVDQLVDNLNALVSAIAKAKPSTAKGQYIRSLYLATTMGPGLKIDVSTISNG